MRIRIPELLEKRQITAYGVAIASAGRIGKRTMFRLQERGGRMKYLDSDLLDALCDVLKVTPGELLEHETVDAPPAVAKPSKRKR